MEYILHTVFNSSIYFVIHIALCQLQMFAIIVSVATLDSIAMSCSYLILAFHPQLHQSDLRADVQYVSFGPVRSKCQDGEVQELS